MLKFMTHVFGERLCEIQLSNRIFFFKTLADLADFQFFISEQQLDYNLT